MKWSDCTADNAAFTNKYDAAVRKIRKKLGSYDNISLLIYEATGRRCPGSSYRRWFLNRSLPVDLACSFVDLMEHEIELKAFFPYLPVYFEEDYLS